MADIRHILAGAAALAAEAAAETLWPTRCAVCDEPGSLICERCRARLPLVDACSACPVCGAPYGRVQCTECTPLMLAHANRTSVPFAGMAHAMVADEAVQRIVRTYKDKGERRLAAFIADACAPFIAPAWRTSLLTYVPDTPEARRRRGFDHAQELARAVAEAAGLPCAGLFMPPRSIDQRGLARRERFANMAVAVQLAPRAPVPSSAIVFDDICTTGSTLYAAADALREAGCGTVYALTFGRVLD